MGKWAEYEERYCEFKEDFIETDEEDVDRCVYCESTENLISRKFKVSNKEKTELICSSCLEEENESMEPALVA